MGVAGSGKTTLGQALAAAIGFRFEDADAHHPPSNVAKMAAGVPLDDADRAPWLALLATMVERAIADGTGLVLACSALRHQYRVMLGVGRREVALVHLVAPAHVLAARLEQRAGHFMPASLLGSQLAALETPDGAFALDSTRPLGELVDEVRLALFEG